MQSSGHGCSRGWVRVAQEKGLGQAFLGKRPVRRGLEENALRVRETSLRACPATLGVLAPHQGVWAR